MTLRNRFFTAQYASEARHTLEDVGRYALPPFPHAVLERLHELLLAVPPPYGQYRKGFSLSPCTMDLRMIVLRP
jgi:hypothetical protein